MILHCDACLVHDFDKPIFTRSKIGLTNIKGEPFLILMNNRCKEKLSVNKIVKFFASGFKFQYPDKILLIKNADQVDLKSLQNQLKKLLKGEKLNDLSSFDQIEKKKIFPTKLQHTGNNIDAKIFKESNLKQINLTRTSILPRQIWKLNQLTELSLIDCNLIEIPQKLTDLKSTLKLINLEQNKLTRIPSNFFINMTNLTCINFSKNLIKILPLEIGFCTQVTSLNFGHNFLTNLPFTLIKLKNLKELNLEFNQLKFFSYQFWKSVSLYLKLAYLNLNGINWNESNGNLSSNSLFPTLLQLSSSTVFRNNRLLRVVHEYIPSLIEDELQSSCKLCSKCNMCFCSEECKFILKSNFDKFTLASLVLNNNLNEMLYSKIDFCFYCSKNI